MVHANKDGTIPYTEPLPDRTKVYEFEKTIRNNLMQYKTLDLKARKDFVWEKSSILEHFVDHITPTDQDPRMPSGTI